MKWLFRYGNTWLLIIATILAISSCKKTSTFSFTKDIKIEIILTSESGEDMFDPESFFYYAQESIKIFYLINGEEVEMNNKLLDPARNFFINFKNDRFRMQLYPNHDSSEEYPVTIIKWNSSKTDIIKCAYERNLNSVICNKVWYNDELVWELVSSDQSRLFEIIKLDP